MFWLQSLLLLCCLCLTQLVLAETRDADQSSPSSAKQKVAANPPVDPDQTDSPWYSRYNPCTSSSNPCTPAYEALTDGMTTYLSTARKAATKRAADLRKLFGANAKKFGKWTKFGRAGDLLAKSTGEFLSEFPNLVSALVALSEGDVHGVMQDVADSMSGIALESFGAGAGFSVGGPVGAGLGAMGGSVVNTVFVKPVADKNRGDGFILQILDDPKERVHLLPR